MKTIYRILCTIALVCTFCACNKEWEDELYKQAVSFGKNGVADIYLRYKPEGKVTYSGTSYLKWFYYERKGFDC